MKNKQEDRIKRFNENINQIVNRKTIEKLQEISDNFATDIIEEKKGKETLDQLVFKVCKKVIDHQIEQLKAEQ